MGSYIIGSSGYTRAQFIAALEEKQDVLVSGINIKTINKASVLGSGNMDVHPREYVYDLTEAEEALKDKAMSYINAINPIDSVTGERDMLMVGFITDLHQMPKNPSNAGTGDYVLPSAESIASDVADMRSWADFKDNSADDSDSQIAQNIIDTWPTSDTSYYGKKAESSIKTLGALAHDAHIDAVFCGGDLSSGRLPYDSYSYMLEVIAKKFDEYMSVPYFIVDGNHDRKYNSNVELRDKDVWRRYNARFSNPRGLSMHFTKDDAIYERTNAATNTDNSVQDMVVNDAEDRLGYYVDIEKGGQKYRLVGLSSYDDTSKTLYSNLVGAMTFQSDYKLPSGQYVSLGNKPYAEDCLVCLFSHDTKIISPVYYYCNAFLNGTYVGRYGGSTDQHYFPYMNFYEKDGEKKGVAGGGIIGAIKGHSHSSSKSIETNDTRDYITITCNTAINVTRFSVFIMDAENGWMYEVMIGNSGRDDSSNPDVEGVYEKVTTLVSGETIYTDVEGVYRYKMCVNEVQ